jgi:stearoyl-CoA desaturase (delta-9 desaturase)
MYLYWVSLSLLIPAFLGGLLTSTLMGIWQGFLWGGLVRIFLSHHATWSLNSIAHFYGTSPFQTQEHSTNNILLVIPTFGEAWHHNHHAFPNSAKFGLYWWQIDFGYWLIRILEMSRLVFQVKVPSKELIELKKVQSS